MNFANVTAPSLLGLVYCSTVLAASPGPVVGLLKDQHAIDGCSWSASSSEVGKGVIFLGEIDDSRTLMNIDGRDVELKLVREEGKVRSLGDTLTREFAGPDVKVYATYKVTWVCPKGSESCEVTRFSLTLRVQSQSGEHVVQAKGDVGC